MTLGTARTLTTLLTDGNDCSLIGRLRFLLLWQSIGQADVMIGAACDLEWLGPVIGCDMARLRCVVFCRVCWKFPTKLVELIRSPRVQLVVLGEHDAVLESTVNLLHGLREG